MKKSYTSLLCSMVTLIWFASAMTPRPTSAAVVPIASIIDNEGCPSTYRLIQVTATEYPDSVVNELNGMKYWDLYSYRATSPTSGYYQTALNFGTAQTSAEKLAHMNNELFGTPKPTVGMTYVTETAGATTCPNPPNAADCWGINISNMSGTNQTGKEPKSFPRGNCVSTATPRVKCSFTQADALVDLGSGGVGARQGGTAIQLSCSQPSSYRISISPSHSDDHGITVKSLTVQGHDLPYVGTASGKQESVTISVEALVSEVGRQSTNRVLLIDIP